MEDISLNHSEIRSFGKIVNFGNAADDYDTFRKGFPSYLFDTLGEFKIGVENQRILDLGTGTGTLALGFAQRGCLVTAVDISKELIEKAKSKETLTQKHPISWIISSAESLNLPENSFDVITAGQCWHWFDQKTIWKIVKRLLCPQGKLVICHFDWLPFQGSIAQKTEKLIVKYNPKWNMSGGTGFYGQWAMFAAENAFKDISTFSKQLPTIYSKNAWIGRIRASGGVKGCTTMTEDDILQFEKDLEDILKCVDGESVDIPHRVWSMICTNAAK